MHALPNEVVASMHSVASKFNLVMRERDQEMFKAQRAEKLKRQELTKHASLQKAEDRHIEAVLCCEKFSTLGWKSAREVNSKLKKIQHKSNQIKELKTQI